MTPERWRAVDTILQRALACEPARRRTFVADACAGDEDLVREVSSLLAAHDPTDEFLEHPAAEALGMLAAPARQAERLAMALIDRPSPGEASYRLESHLDPDAVIEDHSFKPKGERGASAP